MTYLWKLFMRFALDAQTRQTMRYRHAHHFTKA